MADEQEVSKAITLEDLEKEIGDTGKAREVYGEIARIGGFGSFGADFVGGLPALDINGLADAAKKQVVTLITAAKSKKDGKN